MANIISAQTGNWSATGTWQTVETSGEVDSQLGTIVISTANIDSPNFTPGAITVDGVALQLNARAASPSGTFKVTLRNSQAGTDVTSVTINVSDIDSLPDISWYFFKFTSTNGTTFDDTGVSTTLLAATTYAIRVVCSATGSQVTIYRNTSGTNNMSKKIRTTTTQAPAANNIIVISNQFTGAGASTTVTVTMDDTSATSYGAVSVYSIIVSAGATLSNGTAASTNYTLKWKGFFVIVGNGTFNLGTSVTHIPSTSTARYTMNATANTDTGFFAMGHATVGIYGPVKTLATYATANATSGSSTINVNDTTLWENGDSVVFLGGGGAASGVNTRTVNSVTASSVTFTATNGLIISGESPWQNELINQSQRVSFQGASSTLGGFIYFRDQPNVTIRYCQFRFMGSATSLRNGFYFDVNAANGAHLIDIQFTSQGGSNNSNQTWWQFHANVNNITISNNVISDAVNGGFQIGELMDLPSGAGSNWTFNNNWCMSSASHDMYYVRNYTGTFTNNRAIRGADSGGNWCFVFWLPTGTTTLSSKFDGNLCHCTTNGKGVLFDANSGNGAAPATNGPLLTGTMTNLKVAGMGTNAGNGQCLYFQSIYIQDFILASPILQGASGTGVAGVILMDNFTVCSKMTVTNGIISGFSQNGITISNQTFGCYLNALEALIEFDTCTFGSGNSLALSSGTDLAFKNTGAQIQIVLRNCVLSSGTTISGLQDGTGASPRSWVGAEKYGQTATDHRLFARYGTLKTDSVIFNLASPSMRMTPNNASNKLISAAAGDRGYARQSVANGATATFTVWVRKSVSADAGGANYNGNQQRLILRSNAAIGITSDVVLAIASAAVGTWEKLTGTSAAVTDDGVLEAYVDCDGTAGWINVDDWDRV